MATIKAGLTSLQQAVNQAIILTGRVELLAWKLVALYGIYQLLRHI